MHTKLILFIVVVIVIVLGGCKKQYLSAPLRDTAAIIAGNKIQGFSGDGQLAVNANLNGPCGVAADSAGNIYFTDFNNQRIRKVDVSGIITTIAGNSSVVTNTLGSKNGFVGGYSGDGGLATAADLYDPSAIAVDKAGNIYVADFANNRIRKVSLSGIITTLAGTGPNGDIILRSAINFGGDGGPATEAKINGPESVAVDNLGNVYIADQFNDRIRKVDSAGIITTIAGNGNMGFSGDGGQATACALNNPCSVTVDLSGNIYVGDSWNNRIRKIDGLGIITTIAGNGTAGYSGDGGPAASARINTQSGGTAMAIDNAGNLYFADGGNDCIRMVNASGVITTIASALDEPDGVALDNSGNIYFSNFGDQTVRKIFK